MRGRRRGRMSCEGAGVDADGGLCYSIKWEG